MRDLNRSRRTVSGGLARISHAVNVKERLGRSVRSHYVWWIGGAVVAGIIASGISGGREKPDDVVSPPNSDSQRNTVGLATFKPVLMGLLNILLPIVRVFAVEALGKWAKHFLDPEES